MIAETSLQLVLSVLAGLGLLIGGSWALFSHVASSVAKLKADLEPQIIATRTEFIAKCESNYNLHEVKLESLRRETEQKVERVAASESKARHDMSNNLTAQLLKLETAIQRVGEQAVRKEDLGRVERTLDALVLKMGDTAVLTQKVEDLGKRLEKVIDCFPQGKA